MARRDRSGEYVEIEWDCYVDPPWEAIRGWVTPEVYAASLKRVTAQGAVPPGELEHVWLRCNPDPTGEFTCWIVECSGGRGAWKATLRRYPQQTVHERLYGVPNRGQPLP